MLDRKEGNGAPNMVTSQPSVPSDRDTSANRLVYKLVRVGDDGTVLPATEDEVMEVESFGEGDSILAPSDPEASDALLENEQDIEVSEDRQQSTDQDDEKDPEWPEDLEAERQRLLARLQVLDSMLSKMKAGGQHRLSMEMSDGNADNAGPASFYSSFIGRRSSKHKRQRRPNPKYLSVDAKNEFLAGSLHPSDQPAGGGSTISLSVRSQLSCPATGDHLESTAALTPRTSSRGFTSHTRKRSAMNTMPSVISKIGILRPGHEEAKVTSLDNFSIRELHEAFRTTFGRETSVKDKQWLKRQISMGMTRLRETAHKDDESGGRILMPSLQEPNLQARLEILNSAEQPLMHAYDGNIERKDGGCVETLDPSPHLAGENEAANNISGFLCEASPLKKFGASSTASRSSSVLCKTGGDSILALNSDMQCMEGKRQRKPNRRYLEEEADGIGPTGNMSVLAPMVDANCSQVVPKGEFRLSSRSTVDNAADLSRLSSLRSSNLHATCQYGISQGRRSKLGSNHQKRKADGRAAKLVKMARSTRAYQHNFENNIRKVKFKLPSALVSNKNKTSDSREGNLDQISCLSPICSGATLDDVQATAMEHKPNFSNELVATVPTANGGTRRKHHRPWTLREVMTLVEGVAKCGGGKWADIKKSAFSSVSYRTAVDLKDKWRNLLRASRSQLHSAKQGENRKRHFSVSIPGPILARVRELAALQNQTAGSPLVSVTSRSGRIVQRK